jgi:hypothetical protein
MDALFQFLAVAWFLTVAGFGLAAVYHLIMGGLQKDKRQLMRGVMCFGGFVVCLFIGILVLAKVMGRVC